MLKTRSYEMVRSSGNLIQWRKNLFDTVIVYNNKNKPMLRYKFGSVYLIVSLFFSHLGFWSGNPFLIAPFPDLCLLVPHLQ